MLTLGILFYLVMVCFSVGVLFAVLESVDSVAEAVFVSCVGALAVALWPAAIVIAVMCLIGKAGYNITVEVL